MEINRAEAQEALREIEQAMAQARCDRGRDRGAG